jgi:hypothetical protein
LVAPITRTARANVVFDVGGTKCAMGEDDAKILFVVQPYERNVFDQRFIA